MVDKYCWETDGTELRIYSDGVLVLVTPFPTLTAGGSEVLSKDPSTGLPAWSPGGTQILPPTTGFAPLVDPIVTAPTTNQTYCGAALALAGELANWYSFCIALILSEATAWAGKTAAEIIEEFGAQLAKRLILGALGGPWLDLVLLILSVIIEVIQALCATGVIVISNLPSMSTSDHTALLKSCYCALQSQASTQVTTSTLALIQTELNTNVGSFSNAAMKDFFWTLCGTVDGGPLGTLSLAAHLNNVTATGSASTACGAMTCP